MRRRRPGAPHNEVSGGTQGTVIQAGTVERLAIAVGVGARSAVAALAVVLVVAEPELPFPPGYGVGPTTVGWALLAAVLVTEFVSRITARRQARRERNWLTEKNLTRATADLAEGLRLTYAQDERLGQVQDPEPIEVTWEGAGTAEAASISEYFTGVRDRRLVVLGGAGAGKSVLMLRLAQELLEVWTDDRGEPVPVIVQLASWDSRLGLMEWVAGLLALDYPEACTPVAGADAERIALHLLQTGRVLPVLDGFDELPAGVRAEAFAQLRAMPARTPFVLTSRVEAYVEHVVEDSTFQRTETTLRPLGPDAMAAYLCAGNRQARWRTIAERLRADEEGDTPEVAMLRDVLRVPLMIVLARTAYDEGRERPQQLLEPGRFADAPALEAHLYDSFLDVAYSRSRDARALHGGWDPDEARQWAGYLARSMKETNDTELAWWRLHERVPGLVRALALLPAYAVAVAAVWSVPFGEPWWTSHVGLSVAGGYALGCLFALCWAALDKRAAWWHAPHCLSPPGRGAVRRRLRSRAGWTWTILLAAAWAAAAFVPRDPGPWFVLMAVISVFALYGLVLRIVGALRRPADPALARSPGQLLRDDRSSTLAFGPLAAVDDNLASTPLAPLLLPVPLLGVWQIFGGRHSVTLGLWAVVVLGVLLGLLNYVVAASAWGRYWVARHWLALTGELPRQTMKFLADAHRRGILRQSGGLYQFRHIELRDHLAKEVPKGDGRAPAPRRARRRVIKALSAAMGLVTFAALAAVGAAALKTPPLPGPVTSVPAACSLLGEAVLDQVMEDARKEPWNDSRACLIGQESPFARDVRISVRAEVKEPVFRYGGKEIIADPVASAKQSFGFDKKISRHARALHGLGDEAYEAVWQGGLRYGDYMDFLARPWVSQVGVRYGNALISVLYVEEFATKERVTQVARILIRHVLDAAHLDKAVTSEGKQIGAASLGDLPATRLPTDDTRFAYYRRSKGEPRSVYGATWEGRERSHLWRPAGLPFAFRAPKRLDCRTAGAGDDSVIEYRCAYQPDCDGLLAEGPLAHAHPPDWCLGVPEHREEASFSFHVALMICGTSCSDKEADTLRALIPEEERGRETWQRADAETHYATRSFRSGGEPRYAMSLWRAWSYRSSDVTRGLMLWMRAEGPQEYTRLAQKIVNDVYGQTGGERTHP
ncbi:NACHT domain-containing protein [Streptomyces sp. KLOTTS4A1]|uniref:NACHT domain-containing protein n=1 Tax=Streptomyces sp. KLOTTS4A1 TaxID=3390996 RepID=UPI0039F5A620